MSWKMRRHESLASLMLGMNCITCPVSIAGKMMHCNASNMSWKSQRPFSITQACRRATDTTSDCKHQSASNQHPISIQPK